MSDAWDGPPENPQHNSEGHVLRIDGRIEIYRWVAAMQWFEDERGRWIVPSQFEDGDAYLGRIVPPAEIAARERQARERALREAAAECEELQKRVEICGKDLDDENDAIKAVGGMMAAEALRAAILALIEKEPAP